MESIDLTRYDEYEKHFINRFPTFSLGFIILSSNS